jgi:hypothetical protein
MKRLILCAPVCMLLFIPVESVITEETYVIRYSHLGVADPNIQASRYQLGGIGVALLRAA